MDNPKSLAEFLGTAPAPAGEAPPRLEDITDPKAFAQAVLDSMEFRRYVVLGLTLGSLPPAVLTRIMDLAGWLAAPKRKEVSGPNGGPIETYKRIERVIVDSPRRKVEDLAAMPSSAVQH